MTRVLYVIDSLAPGGAERSLAEVAPGLVAGGIRLDVAVLHERDGFADDLRRAGAGVSVVGGSVVGGSVVGGSGRVAWVRGLVRLIRQLQPDLVHTTLYDADQVGRVAAALCRVPSVTSLVNVTWGPEHTSETRHLGWKVKGARSVDVATARLARRWHAVSQTVADEMAPRLHIAPGSIEVIRRGRDPGRLGVRTGERRAAARAALGASGELLVTLARHEPQKRLDVLIEAMVTVRRSRPDARLLVAGREGRETAALRALIARLGLADSVTLLGASDAVAELLCAADVFVLPTRREGLPGSIVEALALEAPIVASDIPAVREVVDEETAVLVPVGSAEDLGATIVSTLADPAGMRARAARGRQRFEAEFTIDVSVRKWIDFYRRAAGSG